MRSAGRSRDASLIVVFRAMRFKEKPDEKTAMEFLETEDHSWNSGMFIWSVDAIQKALGKYRPQLLEMAKSFLMRSDMVADQCSI